MSAQERFEDVASKHQQSVQWHLSQQTTTSSDAYESSSEEEDLNDNSIMDSMLKTFKSTGGNVFLMVTPSGLLNICKNSYNKI